MAFPLAEQGDEHVGAGDLVAAGALHVDRRPLHHALEAGSRLRVAGAVGGQAAQVLVEELAQILAQLVEIDAAGAEHGCGVAVIGEAQQQVFQRRILVTPLACERQGSMERLFEVAG